MATAACAHLVPQGMQRSKRSEKVVKLDFEIERNSSGRTRARTTEKDGIVTSTLYNKDVLYVTYVYAGSNQQKIGVDLDTGSSDLWFVDTSSGCYLDSCEYGTYTPGDSATAVNTTEPFFIWYGDGTHADGFYFQDTVGFTPGFTTSVKNFQFADATDNDAGLGVFGIGFDTAPAEAIPTNAPSYKNMPFAMQSQGLISKVAYSLYLNSLDATTGSVIFGGKDLAKIDGDLVSLPITDPNALEVTLDTIGFGDKTYAVNTNVLLDSGTTEIYIPQAAADAIFGALDAKYNGHVGAYLIPCNASVSDASIDFGFKGISLPVPLADTYLNNITDNNGVFYGCGYQVDRGDILGDYFLRRVYAVYDMTDLTISLGHPRYTDESHIVEI